MATALYTLRQRISNLIGSGEDVMLTGTPEGGFAVTGFTCAALGLYEDDFFNDWYIRFYSGTHKDTTRQITDFVTSTGQFTFSPALASAVDATDLFELHRDIRPERINSAINVAISMVEEVCLQEKSDVTLEVVANQFEYAVPTGFAWIEAIYQENLTADLYSEGGLIDNRHWKIIDKSGTKYIWFNNSYLVSQDYWNPIAGLTAGRNLRVVGQQRPSALTLDADTTNVPAAYLVQQAKALLHQSLITGDDDLSKSHNAQMIIAQNLANQLRREIEVNPRGYKV